MPRRELDKIELPDLLKNPIEVTSMEIPPIWSEDIDEHITYQHKLWAKNINETRLQKMKFLIDFYDIDINSTDGWQALCWKVAFNFIPGFSVVEAKKRGAKIKWNAGVLYRLWYEVYQKTKNGLSENSACSQLVKKYPWSSLVKSITNGKKNSEALYTQYLRSKKSSLVRLMKNIEGQVSVFEYQRFLLDLYEMIPDPEPKKLTKK